MRPVFQKCLETNESPHKTIYHGRYIRRLDFIQEVGEGRPLILATEPVRQGIGEGKACGESAVGNPIVVIGVAPTPDGGCGTGVPESTVHEIRCICNKFGQFNNAGTTRQDHTKRPVPVGLSAGVPALLLESGFEVLNICAMPWQELGSEVDLRLC
jgi:hypothetical protein